MKKIITIVTILALLINFLQSTSYADCTGPGEHGYYGAGQCHVDFDSSPPQCVGKINSINGHSYCTLDLCDGRYTFFGHCIVTDSCKCEVCIPDGFTCPKDGPVIDEEGRPDGGRPDPPPPPEPDERCASCMQRNCTPLPAGLSSRECCAQNCAGSVCPTCSMYPMDDAPPGGGGEG